MMKLWDLAGAEDDRRFSPNCWRVKMVLRHKRLEAEEIPWRFTEKDAIAASGQGAVPVLEDGGRMIPDSWTIACHIEDAHPGPALFDGPQGRALAFVFKHWVERAVHPAMLRVVVLDVLRHLHEKDRAYFRQSREKRFGTTLEAFAGDPKAALGALRGALDPVRPALVQQEFLSGARAGFADYALFGAMQWARAVSPLRLLEPDDPAFAWRERMLDLYDGYARKAKGYPVWA